MPLRMRRYCECLILCTTTGCGWWRRSGPNCMLPPQSSNQSPELEPGTESGARMLGLQWQHVDLVRCVAHLPLTKNGDSRDIPLSRRAVAILKELMADETRDAK